MLPDRPRKAIAPLKESGARWLEVMAVAHRNGLSSTATMMMGTGETNAERIEHIRMIRDVQDLAVANGYVDSAVEADGGVGGFRAFIPWTYQAENNHLKGRTQATTLEYLRFIAVSRLFFDNVAHLQASWLTTGKDVGQLSLHLGVDDLGSIMLEENVISSAGARHRSNLHELIWMIRTAGRIPAQRDTLYRHLAVHATRRPTTRPTSGSSRTSRRSRCPAAARAAPSCRWSTFVLHAGPPGAGPRGRRMILHLWCRCRWRLRSEFQVTFDCAEPERVARFWCEALGVRRTAGHPQGFATWDEFSRAFAGREQLGRGVRLR